MIIIRKTIFGFDAVLKLPDGSEHEIPGVIICYALPAAIGQPATYTLEIDGKNLKFEE